MNTMKNYNLNEHPPSAIYDIDTTRHTTTSWQNPDLTEIGLYYPLGPCRTHFPRERLTEILETLPKVFCALSLEAIYHDAPISATLRSLDQVEFVVTLLGSRRQVHDSHNDDHDDDDAQNVIMELHRRDGDCISFHRLAHQILHAVTTGTIPKLKSHQHHASSWNDDSVHRAELILPRPVFHNRQSSSNNPKTPEKMGNALDVAWAMLSAERHDAQKLGLESLVHMTNPLQSGWANACWATRAILSATTSVHESIGNALLQHACCSPNNHGNYNTSSSTFYNDFHSFAIHPCYGGSTESDFAYLALMVISQLFRVAATHNQQQQHQTTMKSLGGDDGDAMDVRPFLKRNDLVSCLFGKIHHAQNHPHDAYHAIQCLRSLCDLLPEIRLEINNSDILEAEHFGEAYHWALRDASHKLLVSLQVK